MRLTSTGSPISESPAWDGSAFGYPGTYTHMTVSRDGRWALATEMVRFDADLMLLDNFRPNLSFGSGLAADQIEGTGLNEINVDSARLTFPIVIGARFRC